MPTSRRLPSSWSTSSTPSSSPAIRTTMPAWRRCCPPCVPCGPPPGHPARSSSTPPRSTARASTISNGASSRSITSPTRMMRPSSRISRPRARTRTVVYKRRFSAFFSTDLALFLHEQAVRRVVIGGVKTNVCIRATAPGCVRERLRADRAPRGDELQSPAPRRSVARGHRSLHGACRFLSEAIGMLS